MKKSFIPIIIAIIVIIGIFVVGKINATPKTTTGDGNNVSVVDGKQIITIGAKGGYLPAVSIAKAGIPTIIRFETKGTFDCSASVLIPSLNVRTILPQSGKTDIDVGTPKAGILQGMCGMGMYPFQVNFQD